MVSVSPSRLAFVTCLLALGFAACSSDEVPVDASGGGTDGGGGEGTGGLGLGGGGGDPGPSAGVLRGVVAKGLADGAEVCAYQVENGEKGALLACADATGRDGRYRIETSFTGLVWLESTGGGYEDEATGESRELGLLRAATLADEEIPFTPITPLTDAALGITISRDPNDRIDAEGLEAAATQISWLFRLSDAAPRAIPADWTREGAEGTEAAFGHGLALAAFSQYQLTFDLDVGEAISSIVTALSGDDFGIQLTFDEATRDFLCGERNAVRPFEDWLPPNQECPSAPATPVATGNWNDTGYAACREFGTYDTQSCTGTGQDGEFGRDVTHPDPSDGIAGFSFRKVCNSGAKAGEGNCPENPTLGAGANEWGCTEDTVTGLIWEVKTDDGGLRDKDHAYTHLGDGSEGDVAAFVDAVNAAGLCGASDWRLPQLFELTDLLVLDPVWDEEYEEWLHIDPTFFPNSIRRIVDGDFTDEEAFYWARETNRYWQNGYKNGAYVADLLHGTVTDYERDPDYLFSARLVRGTPAAPPRAARFTIADDGLTVTDTQTGLTWQRCAEGQTWTGTTCDGFASSLTREAAFTLAEEAGDGWRLPNVKELASLLYISGGDNEGTAEYDTDVFPNSFIVGRTLSSTPTQESSTVYALLGTAHVAPAGSGAVRLVRE